MRLSIIYELNGHRTTMHCTLQGYMVAGCGNSVIMLQQLVACWQFFKF